MSTSPIPTTSLAAGQQKTANAVLEYTLKSERENADALIKMIQDSGNTPSQGSRTESGVGVRLDRQV